MGSSGGKARTSASKAGDAAASLRENPYVQRLIEDEDLRENIRDAYESARHAYKRMSNGKGPAKAIMDDKKVQRDLRQAAESLREASDQIRGRKRKGGGFRRVVGLAIVGGALVLVLSEGARKALLDRIFGPEEEFEYSSTTSAPEGEPAGAASQQG